MKNLFSTAFLFLYLLALSACGKSPYTYDRQAILDRYRASPIIEIAGTESDGPFRSDGTMVGHKWQSLKYMTEGTNGIIKIEKDKEEGSHYSVEKYVSKDGEVLLIALKSNQQPGNTPNQ